MLHSLVYYFIYTCTLFLVPFSELHANEKVRNVKSQDSSHLHDAQWHAFYYGCIPGGCIDIIQDSTPSLIFRGDTFRHSAWLRHLRIFVMKTRENGERVTDITLIIIQHFSRRGATNATRTQMSRIWTKIRFKIELLRRFVSSAIVFEREAQLPYSSFHWLVNSTIFSGRFPACIKGLSEVYVYYYYEQNYKTD